MKFLKQLFCKHINLELWVATKISGEFTKGHFICIDCGKMMPKKIKINK